MNRTTKLLMMMCLAIGPMAGCDEGSEPEPAERDFEGEYESNVTRGYELLAVVPLEEGGIVEFGRLPSGGIAVVEHTPFGALSPIDTLMTANEATPLELYMALAPAEEPVPAALVQAHERFAVENGLSVEPRALTFEPTDPGFRAHYDWRYAADCSLSADGSWFDNFWQTYNWGWHWYYRGTAYTKVSPSTGLTNAMQAHLCVDFGGFSKNFKVESTGTALQCGDGYTVVYADPYVPTGYRAQFRIWDDPYECNYTVRADQIGGGEPNYSLGITRP